MKKYVTKVRMADGHVEVIVHEAENTHEAQRAAVTGLESDGATVDRVVSSWISTKDACLYAIESEGARCWITL